MPLVREIGTETPAQRLSQRDLVVASLLQCDREDAASHRPRA